MSYAAAYRETMEDSPAYGRRCEREALERATELLEEAFRSPDHRRIALDRSEDLWTVLVADVASPDNELPENLKVAISEIGIFALRSIQAARSDPEAGLDALLSLTRSISEGLGSPVRPGL